MGVEGSVVLLLVAMLFVYVGWNSAVVKRVERCTALDASRVTKFALWGSSFAYASFVLAAFGLLFIMPYETRPVATLAVGLYGIFVGCTLSVFGIWLKEAYDLLAENKREEQKQLDALTLEKDELVKRFGL